MPTQTRPLITDQPGVRYGIANAALVATLVGAVAAHLTGTEVELLALVVAGLASIGLTVQLRAGIGLVAWAMFTGFVVNRFGLLTFNHDDLVRLLVFPLATVAIAAVARGGFLIVKEHAHE